MSTRVSTGVVSSVVKASNLPQVNTVFGNKVRCPNELINLSKAVKSHRNWARPVNVTVSVAIQKSKVYLKSGRNKLKSPLILDHQ